MIFIGLLLAQVYETIKNYDYPTNNLVYFDRANEALCKRECSTRADCIGFVSYYDFSKCWLKTKLDNGGPFRDPIIYGGRVVYFKTAASYRPAAVKQEQQTDASGGDIWHQPNAQFGTCFAFCLSLNNYTGRKYCHGYVFDLGAGKGCWYKGSTLGTTKRTLNIYRQVNSLL